MITKLLALLWREVLEHKNLWRVPLILLGFAILLRMSWMFGNLTTEFSVPSWMESDPTVTSVIDGAMARALDAMNYVVMMAMFIVSVFYTLSCLYNERQDNSILFWRSLPVSDSLTIASKLLVALVAIPLLILITQSLVSIIFLTTKAPTYLTSYFDRSLLALGKVVLWSMVPTISWCLLCSQVAKRNPFLLAFVAPVLLVWVDKLFLNGAVSETLVVNRITGFSTHTMMPLVWGLVFSAVCIGVTITKRSARI
ncbi:ABC transporter permease [Arenicella chitinivorans]|uniref:ABC transporter permease n=1 Tax=Arenicella chitinivorans TaxID=1329800 RepID=A0A918RS69_9GAMM|nr:hypothetical protein [Arenicella chitinivorans]GHA08105.1 ABC transporter permease [Arenicella chitinivorans]